MSIATFLIAQKLEVFTEPCQGSTVPWTSRPLDLPRAGYESKSRKVSPLHLQKWNALSVCMASWSLTHQTLDLTEPKFWNSWRYHPVLNSLLNSFHDDFQKVSTQKTQSSESVVTKLAKLIFTRWTKNTTTAIIWEKSDSPFLSQLHKNYPKNLANYSY